MSASTLFLPRPVPLPRPRPTPAQGPALDDPSWEVAHVPSPVGVFRMGYQGDHVMYVDLKERGVNHPALAPARRAHRPPFPPGSPPRQLQEYFSGSRRDFSLVTDFLTGSAFDRRVWAEISRIPFGSVRSYGEVANALRLPGGARAVGGAAGRNPIPIVVPCHRLVGQDRTLTGYGMGLWRKRWLLKHEGAYPLPRTGTTLRPGSTQRTLG